METSLWLSLAAGTGVREVARDLWRLDARAVASLPPGGCASDGRPSTGGKQRGTTRSPYLTAPVFVCTIDRDLANVGLPTLWNPQSRSVGWAQRESSSAAGAQCF